MTHMHVPSTPPPNRIGNQAAAMNAAHDTIVKLLLTTWVLAGELAPTSPTGLAVYNYVAIGRSPLQEGLEQAFGVLKDLAVSKYAAHPIDVERARYLLNDHYGIPPF